MTRCPVHVSVIIPVYNGAPFLAEAVQSVRRQEHAPLEIIVVDDGSTDATAQVAAGFGRGIRYTYQPNRGPAAARNTGLRLAGGDVIGFLDADDLWTDRCLAVLLGHLESSPGVDLVMGYTQLIRAAHAAADGSGFEEVASPWPVLSLGSTLIRRSAFDVVGLFDERMPYSEDVDWFLRAKEATLSLLIVSDVVQLYRRHKDNLTNRTGLTNRHFVQALKQSLDRRRRQADGPATPLPGWLTPDDRRTSAGPTGATREPPHEGR